MSREGAKREGDTEFQTSSRLWAVSTEPDAGLEPTNCEIMTWAEAGCSTDGATQVPPCWSFKGWNDWMSGSFKNIPVANLKKINGESIRWNESKDEINMAKCVGCWGRWSVDGFVHVRIFYFWVGLEIFIIKILR